MLDRLGKRWIAESTFLSPHVGWHEFEKFNDSTLADFERIPTWVIAGQEVIDAGPLGAVKGGVLNTPGGSTAIGMALEDIPSECGGFEGWSVDNQTEIEKGWIVKADTIEELAGLLGVPADELQKTIDRYNELCDKGTDVDFGKKSAYMHKIVTAPFWGIRKHIRVSSIDSGVNTNANGQALDADGNVIDGLYCVGNVGGVFYGGADYPFHQTGLSLGRCYTFGMLAAKHAMGQL